SHARPSVPTPKPDDFRTTAISTTQPHMPTSKIHFVVHPGMSEIQEYVGKKGWFEKGWTQLSIPWQDLVYTTDDWKTTHRLRSTDVPSPIVNGFFSIPNVPKGTKVVFAIHVGVASSAPNDIGGYRERGDTW